jgi:hypothetical protein
MVAHIHSGNATEELITRLLQAVVDWLDSLCPRSSYTTGEYNDIRTKTPKAMDNAR